MTPPRVLTAAFAAGLCAATGQIALLRDLLVLFAGFEAATGPALAAWLVWTGLGAGLGGICLAKRPDRARVALRFGLLAWAAALPGTVLLIRAAQLACGVPLGELPGLAVMLAVSLVAPAALCLISGLVFAACLALGKPLRAYAAEAAGSALGGIVLYFAIIPQMAVLTGVLLLALVPVAAALYARGDPPAKDRGFVPAACAVALALGLALVFAPGLDHSSRQWQWGPDLAASADTPYQNLAALSRQGQVSVFGGGGWLFSVPDQQTAEFAAHLAMLMHPNPRRVLLIGGDMFGVGQEILSHPGVASLDLIEPDGRLYSFAAELFPEQSRRLAAEPRLTILGGDAVQHVKRTQARYDVVIVSAGEPVSAQTNRFYTVEFAAHLRRILSPGGLACLGLPSSPEAVGQAQTALFAGIRATLSAVFPHVLALPGATARFFAAADPSPLGIDPAVFEQRRIERKITPRFVRDYYLIDILNPFAIDSFAAALDAAPARINTDFAPACYAHALALAASGLTQDLRRLALAAARADPKAAILGALAACLAALIYARSRGRAAAVRLTVVCSGFAGMAWQIIVLIAFQVLAGSLYSRLALLVAAGMAGMSAGAIAGERRSASAPDNGRALFFAQSAMGLALLCLIPLCRWLGGLENLPAQALPAAFSLFAFAGGALGGLAYSLAVLSTGARDAGTAGKLYALDLAGAALGSLAAGLFLVPALGLDPAAVVSALICLAGSLALFASRGQA